MTAGAALVLLGCGGSKEHRSPGQIAAERACVARLAGIGVVDLADLGPAGVARLARMARALDAAAAALASRPSPSAPGRDATAAALAAAAGAARRFLGEQRIGAPAADRTYGRLYAALAHLAQTARRAGLDGCRVAFAG